MIIYMDYMCVSFIALL